MGKGYVLGVGGFYHDYNCALIDVGAKRVAMCEAERLSRRKHHTILKGENVLLPVEKCCRDLGCKVKDIDVVVLGHTDHFDAKDWIKAQFKKAKIVDVDHHLCHAAGGFFSSPYEEAAVLSLDGFGDGSSGLIAAGSGVTLRELQRIPMEHSIGLEYLRLTHHIGLGGYGSEGKTQGLASYGEPVYFDEYMKQIEILPEGNIRLGNRLQSENSRLAEEGGYMNSLILNNEYLNTVCPRRILPEPLTAVHKNLAASIQKVLEHVVLDLGTIACAKAGAADLVLSGGVSMNSSANGHLLRSGRFPQVYAFPMSSDRGTGLGAALYYVHQVMGVPRFFTLDNVFFGQSFPDRDGERAMKKAGLKVQRPSDVVSLVAETLSHGKIVGWFQGRSELGARALGHRSILADPRKGEMKDFVNARVKHREWFRPFAPAVMASRAREIFDYPEGVVDLSLMTFTVGTTERGAALTPATTHVDGTARVQTAYPDRHDRYYQVIERFGEITGVPVVLNTSFNDQGEPIVETPQNAVDMFMKADMDLLCIGDVVGYKP